MSRKDFLYHLFNKDKRPQYVDDNGNVQDGALGTWLQPNDQPTHLNNSPEGWKDVLVKFARSLPYWGVFRDFTVPMTFTGDGRQILNKIFNGSGVESICYMGISYLDRLNLPYNYNSWYLSEINFAKADRGEKDFKVEALEGGLSKFLKAKENEVYEFLLEDTSLYNDGMEFDFTRTYGIIEGQIYPDIAGRNYIGMIEIAREGNPLNILFQDQQNEPQEVEPTDKYFLRSGLVKQYRIHGKIWGVAKRNTGVAIGVTLSNNGDPDVPPGVIRTDIEFYNADLNDGDPFVTEFDETIEVPENYQLYSYLSGGSGDESGQDAYELSGGEIIIEYVYRHKATNVPCNWPETVLRNLVSKMTNGQYTAQSSWLSAKRDLAFSSGNGLRAIAGATMRTSLAQFFKSLKAQFGIGIGIKDNVLIVEQWEHFFQAGIIMDLGKVAGARDSVWEEVICNSLKAGYKKTDYNDVNGKFEFNQGQRWSLPGTKIIKEQDLVSEYRADALGSELLRINYENTKTTDSESDNDTWMFHVKDQSSEFDTGAGFSSVFNFIVLKDQAARVGEFVEGVVFEIEGSASNDQNFVVNSSVVSGLDLWVFVSLLTVVVDEAFLNVTVNFNRVILNRDIIPTAGVNHPESVYNVQLSPRHGLERNKAFLHSLIDMQDGEKVKFLEADKNADLVSDLVEKEDIFVGNLGERLFLPRLFKFKCELPITFVELMNANPYGKIKFEWNNRQWYGWLYDGGLKPALREAQDLVLISAPENDLDYFNP